MNTVEIWLSSLLLLFSLQQWLLPIIPSHATTTQAELLHSFITSNFISPNNTNNNLPHSEEWPDELHQEHLLPSSSSSSSVYIGPQQGLMNADKIDALPGQPPGVKFGQYSGYVTVDPRAGRSLFYYLAESPKNSSGKPLVLWLTGGPGCTTLGFFEIGPYKVRSDGKTLYMDDHAWNNVANVLFVESPAGVGFSYSNTTSDYETTGDRRTAKDSYTFLVNWFQRFPHYKNRDFYIAGQSYCGHFIPQLAHNIVTRNNENSGLPFINLKGIAVGNGLLDSDLVVKGIADFLLLELRNQDNMDSLKGA